MTLTDKLTAIADAIRAKTGNTDKMSLDSMPEAILGLSTEAKESIAEILGTKYCEISTASAKDGILPFKTKNSMNSGSIKYIFAVRNSVKDLSSSEEALVYTFTRFDTSSAMTGKAAESALYSGGWVQQSDKELVDYNEGKSSLCARVKWANAGTLLYTDEWTVLIAGDPPKKDNLDPTME